ncbi:hypothetical protein DUI87_12229 [Hirundo rustica rustica]|uniref:CCHC-type domain-containing protein n=1 Tax=Hirundo rustica rustica TaxID=333673 RepID=A0A3M0KVA6_HIRRU|nr:hypothetical protein DUI87_12229 [Hirundo rustica rustica]
MLPFDIKQTCRLIFDGMGMIVFKQEWEDNCANQLALVTGADHPLYGSSLQWLMGTDPTMITAPQAQAEGLQAHEVMTTPHAAREAIHSASMVIAKPSPWSTIKQSESESFTQFVDWLQAALDSSALPAEAKGPVLAECLCQQCNSATKDILRSLPPGSNLADMIRHVAKEEHFALIQAAVRTAITSVMACFKCGRAGHVAMNCSQLGHPSTPVPPRQSRPRGPCWACGKKGHFAKECRSKNQGNGMRRGQQDRTQPSPTWDVRRRSYANPRWGEALPNPFPLREATNYSTTSDPAIPVPIPGTARTTPWGQDPWVALAVKCDNPPVVWGICTRYDVLDDIAISVPFLIDAGADVTVVSETNWPPHWKLQDAPMVGGVGGLSRAQKSAQLIAIILHTEKGPEKTITLFPYVMSGVPHLLGRDTLALLKARVTNLP